MKVLWYAAALVLSGCATPVEQSFRATPHKGVIRITASPGGYDYTFEPAIRDAVEKHYRFEVDGYCLSYCSLALERMRENVCIRPRAVFGWHPSSIMREHTDMRTGAVRARPKAILEVSEQFTVISSDLRDWLAKQTPNKDGWKIMRYEAALQFWKPCPP